MKEASLRIASLITSTATTTSAPLLLLFPSRSLSCASAIVALSSTCGRGLRSNVACWRKAENKCCCCRTRRTTRSVAAQNLRHQECQQLGDLGDGGGNATTISLGGSNNNNNSGAFKRKASATIAAAAADDDNDDTQVVDRDDSWWAYLLLSANSRKTYVGVSSNVVRRLRQHNGELAGGAKAARAGRPWHLACTVGSFSSRSQACQFEWRWKKYSKSSPRGMDKAVVAGDLPLSAPPQKLVELPVILRRWTALMQAQNEVQEWKQKILTDRCLLVGILASSRE
ncbi:hypothetical protein BDL97_01G128000 [Sphagnum fallax]|nr:hypothetical protein BDL97_01G128000 [Sphagnum fallax]